MVIAGREMLFRDTDLSERQKKNVEMLELVRKRGPIARTEISRVTGFNIVTVSNYINHFLKKGIIVEKGKEASTGGRRPTLVELGAKWGAVIGVDIGPLKTRGAITDIALQPVAQVERPRMSGPMDEVILKSHDLVRELLSRAKVEPRKQRIAGIGVGISGVLDEQAGTVRDTDPARGRTIGRFTLLRSRIEQEFGCPVFIGNDATCAAFGEKTMGVDTDVKHMLYIYSDVGLGIIMKGDIYYGAAGSAGEIQLSPEQSKEMGFGFLRPHGLDLGMVASMKQLLAEGHTSKVTQLAGGDLNKIAIETVIQAASEGDEVARDVIEAAGENLGVRIAYLVNLFNPEVVVVGGGVERAGDLLLSAVRRTVKRYAFEEPANVVRIVPSRLGENAVALGAASLVVRQLFAEM